MELLLVIGVISAVIGACIDGGRGFLLAFFLGPLGLIIAAILANGEQKSQSLGHVPASQRWTPSPVFDTPVRKPANREPLNMPCPSCDSALTIERRKIGLTGRCPACRSRFLIGESMLQTIPEGVFPRTPKGPNDADA